MGSPRKNTFKNDYETEFRGVKKSKNGDEYAHCIPCNVEICLTATGKAAISLHQKTDKHKKALIASNSTAAISAFMPSISAPSKTDNQIAAAEGN